MFSLFGRSHAFCDGISRRSFLQLGTFGAALSLADVLRLRAASPEARTTSKAKSAIMIYLPGGPSHMDMWDLKPEAPKEFRGEFNPIDTNVPGVQICEHFPLQAKMWDRLAVIRSVVSVDEHSDVLVMTGVSENKNRVANHPCFGSVVSKLRAGSDSVPPFVSLRGMSRGSEPGFLGISHRPFTPNGQGQKNLRLPTGVDATRIDDRKELLEAFDTVRRDIDASGTMNGMDSFTTRAFDMVLSGAVRDALDVSKEDAKTRERYKGVEQFLTARRLVEAGVGCVTLAYGSWDTHGQNFQQLKRQLPILDRGLAHLIADLHERGMGDDVLTVCWGEFGRTPKINMNAGRDHWSPVMSAFVAGGGMKMGQAIGASTARGERPKDRPLSAQRVLATLYRAMGIDPAQTFLNGSGRPIHIAEDREPIPELL
jgi:hypothetical protein